MFGNICSLLTYSRFSYFCFLKQYQISWQDDTIWRLEIQMKIDFNLSSQLGNTQSLYLFNMLKCFNLILKCSLSRYIWDYRFSFNQAVCVENSCMVRGSKEGRNGFIHVFRQIIKPAEKSLHEMLRNDKRFRWVASWQRWDLATDCCKIYSTAGLRNSCEP